MRDMACELSLTHQRGDTLVTTCRGDLLNDGSVGPSTPALRQCWLSAVSTGLTLALRSHTVIAFDVSISLSLAASVVPTLVKRRRHVTTLTQL